MSYESWRVSYQSSEQAARAAYSAWEKRTAECDAMIAAAKVPLEDKVHAWECAAQQLMDASTPDEFDVGLAALREQLEVQP